MACHATAELIVYLCLLQDELKGMAGRIQTMRTKLHEELKNVGAPGDW